MFLNHVERHRQSTVTVWWRRGDVTWAWRFRPAGREDRRSSDLRTTQQWKQHPLNVKISPETVEGERRAPPTRRSWSTTHRACSLGHRFIYSFKHFHSMLLYTSTSQHLKRNYCAFFTPQYLLDSWTKCQIQTQNFNEQLHLKTTRQTCFFPQLANVRS